MDSSGTISFQRNEDFFLSFILKFLWTIPFELHAPTSFKIMESLSSRNTPEAKTIFKALTLIHFALALLKSLKFLINICLWFWGWWHLHSYSIDFILYALPVECTHTQLLMFVVNSNYLDHGKWESKLWWLAYYHFPTGNCRHSMKLKLDLVTISLIPSKNVLSF